MGKGISLQKHVWKMPQFASLGLTISGVSRVGFYFGFLEHLPLEDSKKVGPLALNLDFQPKINDFCDKLKTDKYLRYSNRMHCSTLKHSNISIVFVPVSKKKN